MGKLSENQRKTTGKPYENHRTMVIDVTKMVIFPTGHPHPSLPGDGHHSSAGRGAEAQPALPHAAGQRRPGARVAEVDGEYRSDGGSNGRIKKGDFMGFYSDLMGFYPDLMGFYSDLMGVDGI